MEKERLVTFLHSEEIRFTASRIALALGDKIGRASGRERV